MKLIVGLGNPGDKYKGNRHNIGFMFIDYLVNVLTGSRVYQFSKSGNADYTWTTLKKEPIEFYKPQTFMNNSGKSVKYAFKKHAELKIENLYVVHDDLDIPLGKFKIQQGTGPKLHNGIESIENHLQAKDFWRIRIGIDNRMNTGRIDGESYTLLDFQDSERKIIEQTFLLVLDRMKRDNII